MAIRDYLNLYLREELRDYVFAHGQAIAILGINNIADQPIETWYFDENSMAVDNNTTIIRPYSILEEEPGRYIINMVQADWNAMFNKPDLATVATSGSYDDLTDKITAGNGITMTGNEVSVDDTKFMSIPTADAAIAAMQADIDTKVPESRTITINGQTKDLSGNRSWEVGDISSTGSYSNPSWITSLAYSKLSGTPAAAVNADWNSNSGLSQILNKPTLFDGNYNSLSNRPALFSGAYADLTGKPSLFSGSYTDLTNKPTIPVAQVNSDWNAVSGVAQILNKPTIPTNTNQLTNGAGYLTGVTSTQITTALGLIPVDQTGARSAISLTTTGTSGAATYSNSTGVLNIPNYTSNTYTAGGGITISSGVISQTIPTYSTTARTLNTSFRPSTTRPTRVSYTITHTIALTLVLASGSSMVYLEISPDNTNWTIISQAGYSDGVAVAVALTKTTTNNVQGEIPANYYARLRAVTSGAGSAAFTCGQEVTY